MAIQLSQRSIVGWILSIIKLFPILSLSGALRLWELVFWRILPRELDNPFLVPPLILCCPAIMLPIWVSSKIIRVIYRIQIRLDDGAGTLNGMRIGLLSGFLNFLEADRLSASESSAESNEKRSIQVRFCFYTQSSNFTLRDTRTILSRFQIWWSRGIKECVASLVISGPTQQLPGSYRLRGRQR